MAHGDPVKPSPSKRGTERAKRAQGEMGVAELHSSARNSYRSDSPLAASRPVPLFEGDG
jgi:hypothetical protein